MDCSILLCLPVYQSVYFILILSFESLVPPKIPEALVAQLSPDFSSGNKNNAALSSPLEYNNYFNYLANNNTR